MIAPVLSIDCGSSATRCSLVEWTTPPSVTELTRFSTPWIVDPPRAEIDLAELRTRLRQSLDEAGRVVKLTPAALVVSALLAWVPVDEAERANGNAISYADRRSLASIEEIRNKLADFADHAGRPLSPELLIAIDNSFDHRPAGWTSLKDWIHHELLGARAGIDTIHASYSGFISDRAYRSVGRNEPPFASVEPPDTICGTVRDCGRLSGVPLVRGTSDGSAAFYSIAAVKRVSGITPAILTSGTTEVVMAPLDTPASGNRAPFPRELVTNPAVPRLLGGVTFIRGGSTGTVGGFRTFLHNQIGCTLDDGDADLERAAADVPPGSGGLCVFPALEGERLPQSIPGHSASIVGLRAHHRPAHILRALWEAGAYRVNGIISEMKRTGSTINELWVTGGGAGTRAVNQIRADVTGLPVRRLPWAEATSVGSALFAMVALGEDPQAIAIDTATLDTHYPDPRRSYGDFERSYHRIARALAEEVST